MKPISLLPALKNKKKLERKKEVELMQGFQGLLGCKLHIILHVNNILLVEHRIILHKSGLISDYFSHIVTEDRKYFSDQK